MNFSYLLTEYSYPQKKLGNFGIYLATANTDVIMNDHFCTEYK